MIEWENGKGEIKGKGKDGMEEGNRRVREGERMERTVGGVNERSGGKEKESRRRGGESMRVILVF